jgi:hypothetical protein
MSRSWDVIIRPCSQQAVDSNQTSEQHSYVRTVEESDENVDSQCSGRLEAPNIGGSETKDILGRGYDVRVAARGSSDPLLSYLVCETH